jgi:hypothetical protein
MPGVILQTVTLAGSAPFPVFDGTNLWVPVRADTPWQSSDIDRGGPRD